MANPLTKARDKFPWLDHLVRAFTRYQADTGDRLAASVTYFGFLSVFPILALVFSVLGYVVDVYPDAERQVTDALTDALPGLIGSEPGQINVQQLAGARAGAGIIGLAGLLYAGLSWIDALREAVRSMWHQNVLAGNIVVKKLQDVLILVLLGAVLLISLAISGLTTTVTSSILELVNLEDSTVAAVLLSILGPLLALLVDVVLFLFLFLGLPKVQSPWRRVIKGAVFAAVGFEILKLAGAFLIARSSNNPVYASVALAVGLLIWINFVSRFLLFSAAWTVTAPYDSDVAPSGTSSPEAARKSGVPEEYADNDPDNPPVLQDKGAPTRLPNVLQGKTPPQDAPEGRPGDIEKDSEQSARKRKAGSGRDSSQSGRQRQPLGVAAAAQRPTSRAGSPAAGSTAVPDPTFGRNVLAVSATAVALWAVRALRKPPLGG